MAKAILGLSKMPKSCKECPFYKITDICDILSAWNNYMPVDDVTWELVEVIGNIYENPELLNVLTL